MKTRKITNKSPIKDMPLRHPGQSLEEERRKLIEEGYEQPALVALFAVLLAAFEWFRYYRRFPPSPWIFSAFAAVALLYAGWRTWRLLRKARALRLGMAGEKAVGQFLERLRGSGYDVYHDVLAPNFNVDHVLIGPAGIFALETKTWSKPEGVDARIRFKGEQLLAGDQVPDRDPVAQAKAQARWLRNLLADSTGRSLDVFPVLLFPGWFTDQPPPSLRPLWVLEPKALQSFLEREPQRLPAADSKLAAYHLSRYIRASEKVRVEKYGS